MDRRATLATFLGKKTRSRVTNKLVETVATPVNTGLEPYTGPWEMEQASHLLRRTMFGATYAQFKSAVAMGLEDTLAQLFAELPLPGPPLNYNFEEDPNVPIGETWINSPYSATINLRGYRNRSLRAWTFLQMFEEGVSIREKLTLFWHNHFAMNNINDPKFLYRYISLLRDNAWGNFRQLVKDITIDPTMLRFLNGNQNTRNAPNENYARELLELFTIGKGPQVGPGDYTNYTEEDVIQIARILTGWRDRGFNTVNPEIEIGSFFRPFQHDTGEKQLSHRFDEVVISDMGDQEYAHLIDIIFQKDEVARYICRKLYRWFVYYVIDDNAEVNVIEPMAQMLVDNDYEIKPVLETLLRSAHFFDILNAGPMIKHPLDFVMSALKQFEVEIPDGLTGRYNVAFRLTRLVALMEMEYFNLPTVAGWKAYYQEPGFYRIWINATTLQNRMNFTETLSTNGFQLSGMRILIDPLKFINTIDNPLNPEDVIEEFSTILHPQPLTDSQKLALKNVLIPGLPDYEWTVEYSEYAASPDNSDLADAIRAKLQGLINVMINMAEFYLS